MTLALDGGDYPCVREIGEIVEEIPCRAESVRGSDTLGFRQSSFIRVVPCVIGHAAEDRVGPFCEEQVTEHLRVRHRAPRDELIALVQALPEDKLSYGPAIKYVRFALVWVITARDTQQV